MLNRGFGYAFAAAGGHTSIDALRKVASSKIPTLDMVGFVCIWDCIILTTICSYQGELPQFASVMATPELGTLTVASAVLKVVTSAMYQRAVSVSPLSLTVPYLAFTPVLLLITAYVINGELPNPQGFGGVLVVAAGGYLLQVAGKSSGAPTIRAVNSVATLVTPLEEPLLLSSSTSMTSLVKSPHPVTKLPKEGKAAAPATTAEAAVTIEDDDDRRKPRSRLARLRALRLCCGGGGTLMGSVTAPLRALVMEEGSILMLSVAALWSLTSSLDKVGSQMASSFMVFAAVQRLCMAAPIVLYLVVSRPSCFLKMAQNLPIVVATSISELLVIICFLKSLETLLVSYAVAAKRSGIVVSVLVGALVFKEDIMNRLPYVLLMFCGMLLIIFSEDGGHR